MHLQSGKGFCRSKGSAFYIHAEYKHHNIHKSYFPVGIVMRKLCAMNNFTSIAECQLLDVQEYLVIFYISNINSILKQESLSIFMIPMVCDCQD